MEDALLLQQLFQGCGEVCCYSTIAVVLTAKGRITAATY